MVRLKRFELPTFGTGNQRSIQLSYRRMCVTLAYPSQFVVRVYTVSININIRDYPSGPYGAAQYKKLDLACFRSLTATWPRVFSAHTIEQP
jgi:hypothetical protein